MNPSWLAAAEAAVMAAGNVIRPYFRMPIEAAEKADASPVTIADRDAERAMRTVLAERLPGHGILGEEFGLERGEARCRWVLDPIDGTRAFITGRPNFGVLLALFEDAVPVLGIIDQPITGERWIGLRDAPTRFVSNSLPGRPGTRACSSLARAELSCTSPEMLDGSARPRWDSLRRSVKRATWGGDCYAYGLLALGHIDIIAECDMKPWDWAALVPVIEGAGGRITDWQGATLRAGGDGTVLAVGDPALLAPAVRALACDGGIG
ncbi:inositol monophosphatase family protein [Lichenicoccus sp.]|uniref:inositol monophosphatase family protein n=1 Tax=Lichenicoccus sp. TaxID=2781899 RepID=UPI003D10048D